MDAAFVERITATGLTPEAYQELMEQQAVLDPAALAGLEAERVEFAQLNLHRVGRLRRTWRPSPELATLVAQLGGPQLWLFLTEPWCGDSAQCLPCVEMLAPGDVNVRYLLRDDNLDIMDNFLTDGKQGIPMVVAFNSDGREQFRWGPRPAAAQEVFDAATTAGLDKPAKLEKLHLFYGRDRGRALDAELVTVLEAHLAGQG